MQTQNPKLRKGVIFILLAALITLACVCSTQNLPDFVTNIIGRGTSNQDLPENILLQDDFSDPNSGWEVAQFDAGNVGYIDGKYFVTSTQNGGAMWGVAGQNYTDVTIEVTTTQINAPSNNNNDYGILCRLRENADGYSFNISGDGFYSIQRMDDSEFVNLVEWAESNKIKTGNASNTIKAICQGSTLTLFINGDQVAEVTDTTYTDGDIALAATTYEDQPTEIRFDDLVVSRP